MVRKKHIAFAGLTLAALLGIGKCESDRVDKMNAQMVTFRQFEYFYEHYRNESLAGVSKEDAERDWAAFLQDKGLQEKIARETGIGLEEHTEKKPDRTQ